MTYLLDTNACIALINDRTPAVRIRLQRALAAAATVLVSSVVAFELWYGVAKSARPEANARLVETFFAGPVSLLAFEPEDAKVAGRVRASLEAVGKPIGAYDLLIAGQALRHQLTLVTANGREFSRVKGLEWEDWAKG
ncbi:MAG: type II toxin-antitoxin system VapC family toxin [Acidobacteriia bacterium]|nr:type II toxin-antitoxin system VapC family toxin [Terriglobia bacterium]